VLVNSLNPDTGYSFRAFYDAQLGAGRNWRYVPGSSVQGQSTGSSRYDEDCRTDPLASPFVNLLACTVDSTTQISFNNFEYGDFLSGAHIYRTPGNQMVWSSANQSGSGLSATDSGLSPGTTYTYEFREGTTPGSGNVFTTRTGAGCTTTDQPYDYDITLSSPTSSTVVPGQIIDLEVAVNNPSGGDGGQYDITLYPSTQTTIDNTGQVPGSGFTNLSGTEYLFQPGIAGVSSGGSASITGGQYQVDSVADDGAVLCFGAAIAPPEGNNGVPNASVPAEFSNAVCFTLDAAWSYDVDLTPVTPISGTTVYPGDTLDMNVIVNNPGTNQGTTYDTILLPADSITAMYVTPASGGPYTVSGSNPDWLEIFNQTSLAGGSSSTAQTGSYIINPSIPHGTELCFIAGIRPPTNNAANPLSYQLLPTAEQVCWTVYNQAFNIDVTPPAPNSIDITAPDPDFTFTISNNDPASLPGSTGFDDSEHADVSDVEVRIIAYDGSDPSETPLSLSGPFDGDETFNSSSTPGLATIAKDGTVDINLNDVQLPPLTPGDEICFKIQLTSSQYGYSDGTSGAGLVEKTVCFSVDDKPYVHVDNGDVWSGARFDIDPSDCTSAPLADVQGSTRSGIGAMSRYGVFATGEVKEFGSGRAIGDNLVFANNTTSGNYQNGPLCIDDYYGETVNYSNNNVLSGPTVDISTLASGQYKVSGDVQIIASGTVSERVTLIVENGIAAIDSDIKYDTAPVSDPKSLPIFVLITNENILIDNNVNYISGVFIANSNDANEGIIDTCHNFTALSVETSNCGNSLAIDGSFIARRIDFKRTSGGSLTADQDPSLCSTEGVLSAGQANASDDQVNCASEIFIGGPSLNLAVPIIQPQGSGIDTNAIDLQRDLPPLY